MHFHILCLSNEPDASAFSYEDTDPELIGVEYIDEDEPRFIEREISNLFAGEVDFIPNIQKEDDQNLSYGYIVIDENTLRKLKGMTTDLISELSKSLSDSDPKVSDRAFDDFETMFNPRSTLNLIYYEGLFVSYPSFLFQHLPYMVGKKLYVTGCIHCKA